MLGKQGQRFWGSGDQGGRGQGQGCLGKRGQGEGPGTGSGMFGVQESGERDFGEQRVRGMGSWGDRVRDVKVQGIGVRGSWDAGDWSTRMRGC